MSDLETTTPDLPDAGTSQTEALEQATHSQVVMVQHESGMYEVRWDGKLFRLLQPLAFNLETNEISFKVLGNLAADLPFPLELPTLERHARIVLYAYLTPEGSEEEAGEAETSEE